MPEVKSVLREVLPKRGLYCCKIRITFINDKRLFVALGKTCELHRSVQKLAPVSGHLCLFCINHTLVSPPIKYLL